MCQLQLLLFGVPVVKHDEMTLTFSTRKALALLVYLAVEGGLHTRKALSEAFWPELDAKHGRAALRATLLELRRLFEHSHDASERAHLRIERDLLGIEQDGSLVLDLHVVEYASKLVEHGVASLAGQQLEQATRLVRGPFLAGFTLRDSQFFDDWSTQHREYWHRRASQVFDALSLLYEQGGEVEQAIEVVTRWLGFDPLNEEGYRRLMRLRFAQGDRVGALRAFSRCRTVLAEELQVEPEPATVALAKSIRHSTPLRPAEARPPQASPGQPHANVLDGPFLGRTAEFGTLIERSSDLPIPATDEALGHNYLFEAIARLLQHRATRRPLVLLLDDLQGADTATLERLIYLTRWLSEQQVPLLLLLDLSSGPPAALMSNRTG